MSHRPLTKRQHDILRYLAENERATLREIGARFGIVSTNGVNDHLLALERRRVIQREELKSRNIRVTDLGYRVLGWRPINRDSVEAVLQYLELDNPMEAKIVLREMLGIAPGGEL